MLIGWLGTLFLVLALAGCVLVVLTNIALLSQLAGFLTLRRSGLADEAARLAKPLPPDDALPHVVLQLPTFNEGAIVERAVMNAMALDWPRDKLHIQICDDSTDGTTALARAAAAQAVVKGFDAVVVHRDDRKGFKAGSLQAAMNQSEHQYFAILDVDFLSPPDFLRRCMAVFIGDPALAFVQARIDYLNTQANALTRGQALVMDMHYAMEQPVRSWSRQVLPFNGTCGIWRRDAIERSGGWRGESVAEDFELTYHARLKGMRGLYLTTVTAAGELPANLRSWMTQQQRWAMGLGQVAWQMLPRVFGHREFTTADRWSALPPLLTVFLNAAFAAAYLIAIPALILNPAQAAWLAVLLCVLAVTTVAVLFTLMRVANRAAGRAQSLGQFARDFLVVPFLVLYISWAQVQSMPAVMLGRRAIFMRTPKRGSSALVS